jgi:hypothetical protein
MPVDATKSVNMIALRPLENQCINAIACINAINAINAINESMHQCIALETTAARDPNHTWLNINNDENIE